MTIQKIFEELITEASIGKVIIEDESWPIAFNTEIVEKNKTYKTENNFSTLIIKNEKEFFKLLRKYLKIELKKNRKTPNFYKDINRNKIKWLISYLFVNASSSDFSNPNEYIRREISFLEDKTLDFLDESFEVNLDNILNSKLIIKREVSPTTMETPNKITLSLVKRINDEELVYRLPSIYYGIDNDTCYIYSILSPKSKKDSSELENKYDKKINRLLYKLNSGIKETKEYFDYKEGISTYYPEGNITDVTHSFVLSLSIFLGILKSKNITKVKAVPYLPVRYDSRYITAKEKEDKEKQLELLERNNEIQNNITNKFIRTFLRLSSQDKSISIESYPYEVDDYLTIRLNKQNNVSNELLSDVKIKLKERI